MQNILENVEAHEVQKVLKRIEDVVATISSLERLVLTTNQHIAEFNSKVKSDLILALNKEHLYDHDFNLVKTIFDDISADDKNYILGESIYNFDWNYEINPIHFNVHNLAETAQSVVNARQEMLEYANGLSYETFSLLDYSGEINKIDAFCLENSMPLLPKKVSEHIIKQSETLIVESWDF